LRILLMNNGYPNTQYPEYCTYIKTIKECLESIGCEVDLCILNRTGDKVRDYWRLYKQLFSVNLIYEAIYINHWPFVFFPLLFRGIRKKGNIIINWHGEEIVTSGWVKAVLLAVSILFLPKRVAHVVPSEYFKKIVTPKIKKISRGIWVIPSGGVDTSIFRPAALGGEEKRDDNLILGFASGITEAKGCFIILKTLLHLKQHDFETYDKITIRVIEYGKDTATFKNMITQNELDNKIEFRQTIAKEQMGEFYNSIDFLLFPTIRSAESLGLVALESMACGTPVIGTNEFALPEYILNNETGFLFEKGDYKQLASIIKMIVYDSFDYQCMRENCVKLIKDHYSFITVVKKYAELINSLYQDGNRYEEAE
jgi:glycosyltransferase involved in cell wall biosynthesis